MENYNEIKKSGYQDTLEIRLKYQRKFHVVEYFDGVRINPETLPEGKHLYHTRHSDTDISRPLTIRKEGTPVIVNFCGSIVTDEAINVYEDEVKLTYVSWL